MSLGLDAPDLFEAALQLDCLVAKAASPDAPPELAEARAVEERLARLLLSAWLRRARAAVEAGVRAMVGGASPAEIAAAVGRPFAGLGDTVRPFLERAAKETYQAGQRAVAGRLSGRVRRPLETDRPIEKARRIAELKPSFAAVDKEAVASLVDKHVFWVGRHYTENLAEKIRAIASDLLVRRGLSRREAAKELDGALRGELGLDPDAPFGAATGAPIPAGWRGRVARYFELVAGNAATVGRVYGAFATMREAEVETYEIVNPDDERTCPICSKMNGKTFEVGAALDRVKREVAAEDPDDVRSIHPWLDHEKAKGIDDGRVSDAAASALMDRGLGFPPYHAFCRCMVDATG